MNSEPECDLSRFASRSLTTKYRPLLLEHNWRFLSDLRSPIYVAVFFPWRALASREWSGWEPRHGRLSREVAVEPSRSEIQWSGWDPHSPRLRHGRRHREGSDRGLRAPPRYNAASLPNNHQAIGVTLLSCPFLFVSLPDSETLRLFPANHSLPNVISTAVVSHPL